jgi:hypothetical protein
VLCVAFGGTVVLVVVVVPVVPLTPQEATAKAEARAKASNNIFFIIKSPLFLLIVKTPYII